MKKYSKNVLLIAIILIMFSSNPAVSSNNPDKNTQDDPKIAFLMDALYTHRWEKEKTFFQEKVKDLGGKPIVKICNSNPQKQIEQAKTVINNGADVLVVVPSHKNKIAKIVDIAHQEGVKVIAYARPIKKDQLDLLLTFNYKQLGKKQAEILIQKQPEGKYAIIQGPKRDVNSTLYHEANMEILKPYIEEGKINLVKDKKVDEWAEMEGYNFTSNLLKDHPDIDAIIAANDMLATGANMALSQQNLSGKVLLVGGDATPNACQMIIDGDLTATIYQPYKKLAHRAAKNAMKFANGKSIQNTEKYTNNGLGVKCQKLDVITVTKNNIRSTVIESGYIDESQLNFN